MKFLDKSQLKFYTIYLTVVATFLAVLCPAFVPYYTTALVGTVTLFGGGIIAGSGHKHNFWSGFAEFVSQEWAPSFAISMSLAMLSFGVSQVAQAISNAKTKSITNISVQNEQIISGINGYTKHGINSAINHNGVGVKPNAILDAVRNPIKPVIFDNVRKTFRYVGKGAVVILNQQRQIVTTWARSSLFWRIM